MIQKRPGVELESIYPKNPFVCPKKRIILTFLFFSDGIGTLIPILGRGLDS